MNRSGSVLPYLLRKYRLSEDELVLVCDNLDLYPGVIRLKQKGGDAGHNGIKSVISWIGTSSFKRMYIGIGRPENSSRIIEHVLGVPGKDDLKTRINFYSGKLVSLNTKKEFNRFIDSSLLSNENQFT